MTEIAPSRPPKYNYSFLRRYLTERQATRYFTKGQCPNQPRDWPLRERIFYLIEHYNDDPHFRALMLGLCDAIALDFTYLLRHTLSQLEEIHSHWTARHLGVLFNPEDNHLTRLACRSSDLIEKVEGFLKEWEDVLSIYDAGEISYREQEKEPIDDELLPILQTLLTGSFKRPVDASPIRLRAESAGLAVPRSADERASDQD